MYQAFSLISLFLSVHVTGAPQDHDRALLRRDVCDGMNSMPVLYHDYLSEVCPPKYLNNSEGICDHMDYQSNSCVAFCQLRTRFVYGKEFPLDVWCNGPPCIIADFTKTMTRSVDIKPQFEKGLNDGISGGWQSKTTADVGAQGMSYEMPLKDGQCGYWSWIPTKKTVCGTMSYQQTEAHRCMGDMHTSIDYCVDDLRRYPDGTVDGETIFVYTDCTTRLPLPMDQQTSIYRLPGVALDRGERSSAQVLDDYSSDSEQQVLWT
ncbi:hypothetical protein N7519_000290 [Penicillium mononematosum]|uniref:uncharacterized protein n=1 Tax=Penicillium mononematosum TaxID=268346 RepID=UPI0025472267|nr:uncharacterized protein N7519_000290 [Penicillium mononematosum]KAJ6190269.1 hypothetical protein N7519_000290 [Penicillium mononematosum]